jgi:hypothetical protein
MKTFNELNYPCIIEVEVFFNEESIIDDIKGLNVGHALYMAKQNWESATLIKDVKTVKGGK